MLPVYRATFGRDPRVRKEAVLSSAGRTNYDAHGHVWVEGVSCERNSQGLPDQHVTFGEVGGSTRKDCCRCTSKMGENPGGGVGKSSIYGGKRRGKHGRLSRALIEQNTREVPIPRGRGRI